MVTFQYPMIRGELRAMRCARTTDDWTHLSYNFSTNHQPGSGHHRAPGPCGLITEIMSLSKSWNPAALNCFPNCILWWVMCYDDTSRYIVRLWAWMVDGVSHDDHGEWFLTTDCQTPVSGSLHATLSLHWVHHTGLKTSKDYLGLRGWIVSI